MTSAFPQLNALPGPCARLCLDVQKICAAHGVLPGMKLILGVSGGGDSTALAVIFHILAPRLQIGLHVLHIDHKLRPESGADAIFVRELCANLHLPCHIVELDVGALAAKNKTGIEEAGREARYGEFHKFRSRLGADLIVTAHHLDDLCEDILMRLLRGCGWPALGGMAQISGHVFRPFLHIPARKLRSFLQTLAIPWREDASNASQEFLRNRIRSRIMPLLYRENPDFGGNAASLRALAALDREYWDAMLEEARAKNPWREELAGGLPRITLPKKLLLSLHPAARLRLYHAAIKRIAERSGQGQARAETLFNLDKTFAAGLGGKIFQFPGNLTAAVRGGEIIFAINPKTASD